jgi:integrase
MKASLTLGAAIDFYLRTRRSLGFALKPDEQILRSLQAYAQGVHYQRPLSEPLVLDWACSPQEADPMWWARRLVVARRFVQFWHAFDPRVQVPPSGVYGAAYRRNPVHIYSAQELSSLLEAAGALPPTQSLRPATFSTLLALLACTGLRISEALNLQIQDFDAATGVLLIRKSKGGQSRCVPLKASAVRALSHYQQLRQKQLASPRSGAFFLSHKGGPLSYSQVQKTFGWLRRQLGWTQAPIPRLHDLRHTFAVRRLIAWQGRAHQGSKMLALATYLGHRNIRYTYWYLSAVPELLALASKCLSRPNPKEVSL